MAKSIQQIRKELFESYEELKNSYSNLPNSDIETIDYIEIDLCEHLMNAIKAMEYHHQQIVPRYRVKKTWTKPLVNGDKLLKKYGDPKDPKNLHAGYNLQKKFDVSGYTEHKDFFDELVSGRETLKRKL